LSITTKPLKREGICEYSEVTGQTGSALLNQAGAEAGLFAFQILSQSAIYLTTLRPFLTPET
jgi:hypothetical protein